MTVAELITELEKHDLTMPVGILYDNQMGFYPAHEVKVYEDHRYSRRGNVVGSTDYVCVCDKP